jgi:hypothetical protein
MTAILSVFIAIFPIFAIKLNCREQQSELSFGSEARSRAYAAKEERICFYNLQADLAAA